MNLDITEKWAKEIALMSDADFEQNCKHIEALLNRRKQALRIHDVVGRSEQYHCELYDFGRRDKPCDKQCDGCKAMTLD